MSTLQPASRTADEGPASTGRALARCVGDPAAFAKAWGREPLHTDASNLPRTFDDLLDPPGIDELLSRRGLRTPFLRMAKDGVVVPASSFTRSGGVGATVADQIDSGAVARLFADGTTIVIQALHRIWPPVIEFAGRLRDDVGHPVQVNAYVTPPSSRGFSAHYDVHDVFVLQLAGEKRWVVHEPVFEAPLQSQPWTERRSDVERAAQARPPLDVVLRPGDALYLPRGFIHAAEALGGISAHLTVGIHVVTRHAIVEELVALARDDVDVRRSLSLGLDLSDASAAAEVAATISALRRILGEMDEDAVVERLQATLAAMTPPPRVSPLAEAAAAERP
jgi:JmjC domain